MPETDPDPLLWQLLLQLILIALNAVFACAEIAVISINDAKLERLSETGNKKARRLLSLTSQPSKFLATIQVGITLAGFLGSAFAAGNFSEKLVRWLAGIGVTLPASALQAISVVIITLILSYITLVLGELVPKRIAMQKAEAIGLAMSGLVYAVSKAFTPIVWLLTVSTNGVLRLFGIDPNAEDEHVTEEEIRIMVDAGSENGTIDIEEKEFIHNLFDFDDLTAEKIMTHRTEVSMLWIDEDNEEWEKTIHDSRYSIYPICEDNSDNIVGVLNTRDYFRLKDKSRESILQHAVKPPQFVPESVRADMLLRNMKKNRNHFAIVMDEYGGMSGIITINDLLEQLVGDLEDDAAAPEEKLLIEQIDSKTWRVNGAAPLDEVEKTVGMPLPCDEYDTFAGMTYSLLGSIPEDGSTPEIDGFGLNIRIIMMQERRLEAALICKLEEQSEKG
ncbi:MAG: hemolysin family protein [Oscillospiraceae bacterium]|jgi:putative hemolysin|nr:hemolysin family protein [Oscillospiraceae bacterium]